MFNLRVPFGSIKELERGVDEVRWTLRSEVFGHVFGVTDGHVQLFQCGFVSGFLDEMYRTLCRLGKWRCDVWCKLVRVRMLEDGESMLDWFRESGVWIGGEDFASQLHFVLLRRLELHLDDFVRANVFETVWFSPWDTGLTVRSVRSCEEVREALLAICSGGHGRLGAGSPLSCVHGEVMDFLCWTYVKFLENDI